MRVKLHGTRCAGCGGEGGRGGLPAVLESEEALGGGGRGGRAVPDVEEVPEVLSPRPWNQRRRRQGGRRGDGEGGLTTFPRAA